MVSTRRFATVLAGVALAVGVARGEAVGEGWGEAEAEAEAETEAEAEGVVEAEVELEAESEAEAEGVVEAEVELEAVGVAEFSSTVVGTRSRYAIVRDQRAVSVVDAEQLAERAPRSTPEALADAPGVSVQKTNHAGGAPFVRGRTGQQTLIMLDGFRFNTSIMRSGPNQYLATIDPLLLDRIEVLRGAGAVLYGSDAIGGVVDLSTRAPRGDAQSGAVHLRGATADRSAAGRAEVDGRAGPVAFAAGVSARRFGDLRSGGAPALAEVPVYDGDVQLFSGYDELAADARATVRVGRRGELSATALALHQYDAPRTDRCTPDPLDCRVFAEQFYDAAYLRYTDDLRSLQELSVGAIVARTHERRERTREARDQLDIEIDDVVTIGVTGRASLPRWRLGRGGGARVSVGAEAYADRLASAAATRVLSTGDERAEVRGKYLDGSGYQSAATFAFAELVVDPTLSFSAGARLTGVRAAVAADPESGRDAFTQTSLVPVAGAGVRVELTDGIAVVGGVNQGFRAPNLDDLTARSAEGPGFQLANPALDPETSVTVEGGVVLEGRRGRLEAFSYQTYIDDFIGRIRTECPPELADQCGDADNVYTLTNAGSVTVRGLELGGRLWLPAGLSVAGTATFTVATRLGGDGPDQPEAKIPPLSGRVRVRWDDRRGRYFVETASAWARRQDRLSPDDETDPRIPPLGTPGYGVVDVRVGARLGRVRASVTAQNITDTGYRVHGSGVDGPGFGLIAAISATTGAF